MHTVPFSEPFEKALLVSILQNPLLLPQVQQIVTAEDFYQEKNRGIFEVICAAEPDKLDSLTVQEKLDAGTQSYFEELVSDADAFLPTTANALYYAEVIRDKRKLRDGIDVGNRILNLCYTSDDPEETIHQVEELFSDFLRKKIQESGGKDTAIESFHSFLEKLRNRNPEDEKKIKTGFIDLDVTLQKLEGLVVLAGKPGLGKTSLVLNILTNVLRQGHTAIMFSLEQPTEQIFQRMLSVETGIPLSEIREGVSFPSDHQIKQFEELLLNFHIDDRPSVPASYISSVARQKSMEWGKVGVILIDYLNLIKLNDKATVEALGDACKDVRALGKELDCPVILLAQQNRGGPQESSSSKKRRPELYDLRSSGEIEQVADQVLMLYRESYFDLPGSEPEEDVTEVLVRKNRNGNLGMVELKWRKSLTKFENLRG